MICKPNLDNNEQTIPHLIDLAVILPAQDKVIEFLDGLSDDALKKEATTEARSDTFSSIMKVRGEGGKRGEWEEGREGGWEEERGGGRRKRGEWEEERGGGKRERKDGEREGGKEGRN